MNSDHLGEDLRAFLVHHSPDQVPIVCVTSGGTIVPLEKNMVRFIDNFSGGERGATSAECFLSLGYVVIFLHRIGSRVPFIRSFGQYVSSKVDDRLLSKIQYDGDELVLDVDEEAKERIKSEVECSDAVKKNKYYFPIQYETVDQYLALLQLIAKELKPVGSRAMFYLAAAMCEHKIQSSSGLTLELEQVPKVLGTLCQEWAPQCFVVSFKLETDEAIVHSKAKGAIEKYGVHLVVANLLQTRREVCYLVSEVLNRPVLKESEKKEPHYHITTINRPSDRRMIEPTLVEQVVIRHSSFYERASVLQSGAATTDTYVSWIEEESPQGGTTIFSIASERDLAVQVKQYVDMMNEFTRTGGGIVSATAAVSAASEKTDATGESVPPAVPAASSVTDAAAGHHALHHESHHHHERELGQEVSRFRRRSALKVLTLVTVVGIVSFYMGRRWR